jgi:uncharacterized damage-inducible protein DinB
MASYNSWMNSKVYHSASLLSDQDRKKNVGAFFKSLHGTLNHLVVGDTIWTNRFAPNLRLPVAVDQIKALNQILTDDFGQLLEWRRKTDDAINQMVEQLTEAMISGELTYTRTDGETMRKPFAHTLVHFFNHQTHHRGQASTILKQQGLDLGQTDLTWMPKND